PRPTGWLIDNVFEDLYYGFYSYEADDVVIIGNEYKNNIVYGIDPHDRSRRLIIANNDSYGAKRKHGIIFSREVNDSWIFNNHSHHNQGSGIMLDRNCVGNVIANNQVDYNENDGVVFIESPHNKSYANVIRNNGRSGVRIRNSWDITLMNDKILENNGYAMLVYQAELKDRDVQMDPYAMRSSFDVIGAEFSNNTAGNINMMNIERAGFYNISVLKSPGGYFEGASSIKNLQSRMYDLSSFGQNGTEIYQLNYVPKYSEFWDQSKQGQ
ncbi:MAG: NosD domain-containing protein, partial [Pseudomonadota bacterium]